MSKRQTTPKSQKSRSGLLEIAAQLFKEKGYAATTLRDIASAANMKAASVYYHFDSKEKILEEVLDAGIHTIFEAAHQNMAALPPNAPFHQRLEIMLTSHMEALLKYGAYTSANVRNFGQVPSHVRQTHLPIRRKYDAYWIEFLEDAKAKGDIRPDVNLTTLRLMLIGAVNWTLEWYEPGHKSIEDICREFADIAIQGLRPDASH